MRQNRGLPYLKSQDNPVARGNRASDAVWATLAAEYQYQDKPRFNWAMFWTFLGCFVVDILVLWALIQAAERYAR